MPDKAIVGLRDFSREVGHMSINTVDIAAGNLAAQLAALTTLETAVTNITRGVISDTAIKVLTPGTSILPTDEEAQIEKTWLILYTDIDVYANPPTDTVPNPGFGKVFQVNWPTALYTGFLLPDSDFADLANADISAFVAAFEALVVSPYNGEIQVLSMQVGAAR